jgi:hypothetical protein
LKGLPLLTNDRTKIDAEVLEAHKRPPTSEKRFEQTKTVFEIAPVLLKNEGCVEALFFIYLKPELTELQQQILTLLGVPESAYRISADSYLPGCQIAAESPCIMPKVSYGPHCIGDFVSTYSWALASCQLKSSVLDRSPHSSTSISL